MKSDHWNFLANLLGTPGPAKPRDEKAKKADPSETKQPESGVELSQKTEAREEPKPAVKPQLTSKGKADDTGIQVQGDQISPEPDLKTETAGGTDAEPITREDILDALTASAPPKVLPGFGLDVQDDQPNSLDQLTQREPEASVRREKSDASPKKKKKRASSSFGDGLKDDEEGVVEAETPAEETLGGDEPTPADETITESTQAQEEASSNDSLDAWAELASEIGLEPEKSTQPESPKPQRSSTARKRSDIDEETTESGSSRLDSPAKARPKRSKNSKATPEQRPASTTGFGHGLGFDDLPKNDAEKDNQPQSTAAEPSGNAVEEKTDELDLPGGWASFTPKESTKAEKSDATSRQSSRSSRQEASKDHDEIQERKTDRRRRYRPEDEDEDVRPRRPRSRRGESGEDDGDRQQGQRRPSRDEAEANETRPPRTRGRRGARQRMSDEDVQKIEEESTLDRKRRDDEDQQETAGNDGRKRGSRKRRRDDSSNDDARLHRARREDSDNDQDEEREATSRHRDEDDETPSRGRRRGRRGRGGRGRSEHEDSRETRSADKASDPLENASAFDDDHEDDHEIDAIRQGQRSNTRGRQRNDDDRDTESGQRGRRRRRSEDSNEEERAPRSRRDQDTDNGKESRGKRTTIPSWLETVDLLVNANIENHKKPKGGRGRSNKKR